MGIYAQTDYQIKCKNKKVAQQVADAISEMQEDENGNDYPKPETNNVFVEGFLNSVRIQNLEYKCNQVWEKIKDIKGVLELDCPFMSEADGMYYTNENENN